MPTPRSDQTGSYTCSFCGKAQSQVKRLIAGPDRVFICDECVGLCGQIISEESPNPAPRRQRPHGQGHQPQVALQQARRVRHRPGARQEGPQRRGLQPLQARLVEAALLRRRAAEVQHPAPRPRRLRQDAAGPDAGEDPRRALRDSRRHLAHRGGLRRRGRREHPPPADPGRRLRHLPRRAGDHLHRRDRQDRPQEPQPVHHARRLRGGSAAGAA